MGWFQNSRRPTRKLATVQAEPKAPAVRPPTGFLSWAMLSRPDGSQVACMLRRMTATDAMTLVSWPEPTYFDWLGLLEGRASGRQTRAGVSYEKAVRLQVIETFPTAEDPPQIVGAIALCDRPKDRPDALELAYLERSPLSHLTGFGTAALALSLLDARDKGLAFFLDALLKSRSNEFYSHQGLVEVDGTPWPTVTVRMAFPSRDAEQCFLAKVRDLLIIP